MNNDGILASVKRAAMGSALSMAAPLPQLKENDMSTNAAADTPAGTAKSAETVSDLDRAYPLLTAQIRTAAATAERERILAIESFAVPGHEPLVKAAKENPEVTAEKLSMQILQAEKATRGQKLDAVKAVEVHAAAIKADPSSGGGTPAAKTAIQTPEGWAAEYAESPSLQADYATSADYVAFKKAEASGKIRILGGRKSA